MLKETGCLVLPQYLILNLYNLYWVLLYGPKIAVSPFWNKSCMSIIHKDVPLESLQSGKEDTNIYDEEILC